MTPDCELLATFARTNSEDAFAELVQRHVSLVYSAALRQVGGDGHLAQDVAQTVFTDLARKAVALARRESLAGWLYTSTHFAAAKIIRTETRRRDREETFMRESDSSGTGVSSAQSASELAEWQTLSAALDAAMHELKEADREAILLRYFENRPFAEVGGKLGLNENAARMRVERALEKLRGVFAKRGLAASATLAAVISANAVQAAPASLATTLTPTAIAAAGTGGITLLKIMTAAQTKLAISALIVAATATAFVLQHQAQEKLHADNDGLTQRLAQLEIDNASLSNRLVTAGDNSKISETQFNELLKLRGEVGLLRNKAAELSRNNAALQNRRAASRSETNFMSVPQVHIKSRFMSVPKEAGRSYVGLLGATPGVKGSAGILNDKTFRIILAQLEKQEGVEVLGEPEVITTSGRQCQMRATQLNSVITNYAVIESGGTNAIVPQIESVETGSTLDVTPRVLADGIGIFLPLEASFTDFLGYESPANSVTKYTRSGEPVDVPQASPQFRVQEAKASANVWDNQTMILKLPDRQVSGDTKAKTPPTDTLVFVTVTIVDAAGNRKNKPEERDDIPDQSPPAEISN